jgi:hypothetical protein
MITSSEEWEASKAFNDLATELRDKDHIKAEDVNKLLKLLNSYIQCPVKSLSTQNAFFEEFSIVMERYKDQSNTDTEL